MNMKLPVSRIQCEPDRTYSKADDMHLRANIKSRLDKGLKPLLQPVALKKLENNPDYDYAAAAVFWRCSTSNSRNSNSVRMRS